MHSLITTLAGSTFLLLSSLAAAATPAAAPAAPSSPAVFPSTLAPKYAKETPGKARMHTCLDQYKANKPGHANGGLKWIQAGGGYYKACSHKLKT